MKITTLLISLFFLTFTVLAQSPSPTPAKDPESELRLVIENAAGREQKLIENLEGFLKQFPEHRRGEIEREIFKLSLQHDRNRAITYAQKISASNERDLETLAQLIGLLRGRHEGDDLKQALTYSDQLVERVETVFAAGKPGKLSAKQWADHKERSRAAVSLLRGQVLADLGENDKAAAEFRRSYKAARLAVTAVAIAELAEKRQARNEAIDYYLQALAISFDSHEMIDRKEVRRKLGQSYAAKNGSERGLGDRLLEAYDQQMRQREDYMAGLEIPNINKGVVDPLKFKMTKLEGGTIQLADYRGKIVVLNFWATWCGPCRVEMPLFEQVMLRYKNDPNVVFLAVNTDEDRDQVKPYLATQKFKLPIVYADYIDEHYAVQSIPTTIVLDGEGRVSFRQSGFNSQEDLVAMLSTKIEAAKK